MSSEWNNLTLKELCTKIGSGATPRGGSKVYTNTGEFALIRSQNIYNERFDKQGIVYISKDHADKLSNVEVLENDVLLNITGDSVARCCQVDSSFLPARVNQHVAIIRSDPNKLDQMYLRYYLISPYMQKKLLSLAESGGTRNALTKGMIESLEINLPPLPEQKRIAKILGDLDDKIELNRRMNETLEGMAQALFKSWFVDFDPVIDNALDAGNDIPEELAPHAALRQELKTKGEYTPLPKETLSLFPASFTHTDQLGWIPEGWTQGAISDISNVKGGYAFKSKDFTSTGNNSLIKIKNINLSKRINIQETQQITCEIIKKSQNYILNNKDILMAMSGATVGKFGLFVNSTGKTYYLNQRVAKFESIKNFNTNYYMFCQLSETNTINDIINMAYGSAQPNISAEMIMSTNIILPDEESINEFTNKVDNMFNIIISNEIEIQKLSNYRNILLPKLLSN